MIERFPHDALVSFDNTSELNETILSSSVAAPQNSNTSRPNDTTRSRRRLTEIAEDASETPLESPPTTTETQDQLGVKDEEQDHIRQPSVATTAGSGLGWEKFSDRFSAPERSKSHDSTSTAQESNSGPKQEPDTATGEFKVPVDLTQDVSAFASDASLAHLYKPKIKLAPRPSLESRHSGSSPRPVASLPPGIRIAQRESDNMRRPQTQQAPSKPFFNLSNVSVNGGLAASAYNAPKTDRPNSRAGSAVTVPANPRSTDHSNTVTPEKQRLMKALQKRKKNQVKKVYATEAIGLSNGLLGADAPDAPDENRSSSVAGGANSTAIKAINGAKEIANDESSSPATMSKEATESSELKGVSVPNAVDLSSHTKTAETGANHHANHSRATLDERNVMLSPMIDNPVMWVKSEPEYSTIQPRETSTTEGGHPIERNSDIVQNLSSAPATARQGEPQDVPLPLADGEEKKALGIQSNAQYNPELPTATVSEPTSEIAKEKPDGIDPITVSIQHVQDLTLERKQRPPPITPVRPEDISRAPSLSDDSLLEELQSATVEEAKSVSLAKTPTTPFSPASPRRIEMRRSTDALRRPLTQENEAPLTPSVDKSLPGALSRLHTDSEVTKTRRDMTPPLTSSNPLIPANDATPPSIITALPNRIDSVSPSPKSSSPAERSSSKKSGVSSLISQRIKAFENFGTSTSKPSRPKALVTPQLVTLRKSSLNTPPASAGAESSKVGGSFGSQTGYPTPSPSPHSFSARLFRSTKTSSANSSKKETSVKKANTIATNNAIVKNVSDASMDSKSAGGDRPRSPSTTLSKRSSFFGPKSPRIKSSSVSSMGSSRDAPLLPRTESSGRKSTSSRRSSTDTTGHAKSQYAESIISESDKKESKKKRLFKRLSSLGSAPRRGITQALSPTLTHPPILESQEPEATKKWAKVVTVGEVNVQFPDTLVRLSERMPAIKLTVGVLETKTPGSGRWWILGRVPGR